MGRGRQPTKANDNFAGLPFDKAVSAGTFLSVPSDSQGFRNSSGSFAIFAAIRPAPHHCVSDYVCGRAFRQIGKTRPRTWNFASATAAISGLNLLPRV